MDISDYVYGWRQKDCTACSGSGRYDSHRSPKCGTCNGTGKEKYRGPDGLIICHECLLKIDKPPNNCALWAMFYLSGLGLAAWSIYQLV
jgi:hypothetical protein